MMNNATPSELSKPPAGPASVPALSIPCAFATSLALLCLLCLAAGCSKGGREPKIFGKSSDPPVTLQCAWKPGYRYHLRLEMAVQSDTGVADPEDKSAHLVTFVQDCMVTATSRPAAGNISLDMEILSLGMERARGTAVTLSFDSAQGGEASDDYGYVPVMTNLIGGHLRFLVSPDGKMLPANGLKEWLDRAIGDPPAKAVRTTNAVGAVVTVKSAPAKSRSTVSTTLRGFFTADLFRQMIEFGFLPPVPVRVGQEWKTQGDIPISGHGRFMVAATGKFEGWQQHGVTNCARLKLSGKLLSQPAPSPAATAKQDTFKGILWIDPDLNFPATTVLDAQVTVPDTTTRKQGTNTVTIQKPPRTVRQNVTITLLEAGPIDSSVAEAPR